MTGPKLNDYIVKALTGSGIHTDEMESLRDDYVSVMRDGARGAIINNSFIDFGSVAPIYYQEIYANESEWVQEDECVYKFPAPSPLTNPEGMPWIEWIGGSDWNCDGRFRLARSRTMLVQANKHHLVGRTSLVRAFYDNNANLWWIYRSKKTTDFAVRQICNQPYDADSYNIDQSEYPFPMNNLDMLIKEIQNIYYKPLMNAMPDTIPNSREDSKVMMKGGRR